jgi:small-conductance mechanosensitive channel
MKVWRAIIAAALIVGHGHMAVSAEAPAPEAPSLSAADLDAFVEQAKRDGVRIIVVDPNASPAPDEEEAFSLIDEVEEIETSFGSLLNSAARDVKALPDRIAAHWPEAGWDGLTSAILIALAAFTFGWLVEIGLGKLFSNANRAPIHLSEQAARYWLGLRAAFFSLLGIAFQMAIAIFIFAAIYAKHTPEREVGYAVILMGGLYLRIGLAIVNVFFRRPSETFQLISLTEDDARVLRRDGQGLVTFLTILVANVFLIAGLGLGEALVNLTHLCAAIAFVLVFAMVVWKDRRLLTNAVFPDPSSLLARIWPALMLAYFAISLVLVVVDVLLGAGSGRMIILAPVFFGVVSLAVYAGCMLVALGASEDEPEPDNPPEPESDPTEPQPDMSGANLEKEPEDPGASIAGAIAFAFWIGGIAWAWGVPLRTDAGQINGVWTVLLILLLARFGWVIIRGFFDRRIAKERGSAGSAEPGDEGGAAGSRLGTLLPLFRSFLLITVGVIAMMTVLSKIGVDIAPLFAGAGLVGMAIGFGSQSLVKDIFSGLFFLVDDAFRVGEYIETGGLRGTVEKISIRSMQLRHHTGPLHTIPFGEVTQLTNFSRDWVIMKLPLRVTFDTDPEKVRKLIKKLGRELLDDPVIGDKFVEPLKSQGVREIDDSGQVIRVKFMTRPGEQFVLRKTIYARIRDLFEREGIEFARKEVRVRVSEQDHPLSDKELKEIAGAAAEGALEPPTPRDPTSR